MAAATPRPIIGISAYPRTGNPPGFAVPCGYVDAVRRAGAIPIALPPGDPDPGHYLDLVDGLILAGGGDIDPDAYGGAKHETIYSVCGERDAFELRLVRAALSRGDTPMLCICRGMQILNVALGGDLHVDIPDAIGQAVAHRRPERRSVQHQAKVDARSRLGAILGASTLVVESWHHQAVREIGRGLKPVAWAEDGIVEAVEHLTHPWCMAVQWHPELQPNCPTQQRLFSALVAATSCEQVAARSA
jgi:putative glutamine amidotransferase